MGKLVFVIGYPRSGNHWLCRTLSDLFSVPIAAGNDDNRFAQFIDPDPDFKIKITHWTRSKYDKRGHGWPVIHTIRDPRDVCTSLRYYGGHRSLLATMQWMEEDGYIPYVKGWKDRMPELWMNYEFMHDKRKAFDLLGHIYTTIRGHDCNPAHIAGVIEHQKFDNWLHTNRRIMRKGTVGNWRDHFRQREAKIFEEKFAWALENLGYEFERDWWRGVPQ
jgi:hypothetical protein